MEAKKIVELQECILKERKNNETISIITFNINQDHPSNGWFALRL